MDQYLRDKFSRVERGIEDMHDYQINVAVPFMLENPFSALFIDLGLGKTCISLTVIAELVSRMEDDGPILVIGPLRVVHKTWPDEIGLWRHTAHLNAVMIRDDELQQAVREAGQRARAPFAALARVEAVERGLDPDLDPISTRAVVNEFVKLNRPKIDAARIEEGRVQIRAASTRNPATIHLVNREQVEFLVEAWGRDWPYKTVFIDESSVFKDHNTNRFKALVRVRPLLTRLHQLTATPAAEGYMGLFAQMYLLDRGQRLGKNIGHYRNKYFVRGYDGFTWSLRPDAEEEIAAKISDICLTMKAEDYLKDLKKPVFNPRFVDLSRDEMAQYRSLQKDFIMELDDGTEIEAESAANLSGKLLQLAAGFVYDENKKVHEIHNRKIDELRELVEEANGNPLLVAYWFKPSLQRLKAAFPKAVVIDKEAKLVDKWNKGQLPIMLVHPQSAGHGLNLQKGGHHLVFFDIPWSLELYLQLIGRLARQGQKNAVVLHHIMTRGTIDETVVEALKEKRDVQEQLFIYLKALRRRARGEDSIMTSKRKGGANA